ncbi:MAG: toxin-antitoxin system HicB family antitoxin [Candidatus Accumulibacter sp.]|nr:toxin-antitoxin system HicB family antitoxin [Candidatus Accumulibacter propinquus]
MTTLNLTLPNSIQRHLQEMADLEGVPIDQFITSAVAEKISALTAETYLQTRADRADPAAFQAILDQVPQRAPLAGDE